MTFQAWDASATTSPTSSRSKCDLRSISARSARSPRASQHPRSPPDLPAGPQLVGGRGRLGAPRRPCGLNVASALFEDSAPSAAPDHLKARPAPTHPRAPLQQLGGLRWPQQPASGRPKGEDLSLFHPRRQVSASTPSPGRRRPQQAARPLHLGRGRRPTLSSGGSEGAGRSYSPRRAPPEQRGGLPRPQEPALRPAPRRRPATASITQATECLANPEWSLVHVVTVSLVAFNLRASRARHALRSSPRTAPRLPRRTI